MSPAAKGERKSAPGRGVHDQLVKLGIAREHDLVLHLPLRYEDHTRLVPLRALRPGVTAQAEGTVVNADIQFRPRRQLIALIAGDDDARGEGQLTLRFFHFYPNTQKARAKGNR